MSISISTIIPAYNCDATLSRALDSILTQTYLPDEIIIVNDGSTDCTSEIIAEYTEKHSIIRSITQENSGPAAARNHGVKLAKGDWISFLDSDDYWYPCHLENLAQVIIAHTDLVWAAAAFKRERVVKAGKVFSQSILPSYLSIALHKDTPVNSNSVLIQRLVFWECGGFREDWRKEEDLWLWFQIGLRYPQIGYSPVISSFYSDTPNSISKQSHSQTLTSAMLSTDQMIQDLKTKNLLEREDVQIHLGECVSKILYRSLFLSMSEYRKLRNKYRAHLSYVVLPYRAYFYMLLSSLGISVPCIHKNAYKFYFYLRGVVKKREILRKVLSNNYTGT